VALYMSELLSEHGYATRSFGDPAQALAACRRDPDLVDVLVTDQRMPRLSGDALAQAMLGLRPGLRVVLCTGFSELIDARRARALGIQHFLRKPFEARALLRAVRGDHGH